MIRPETIGSAVGEAADALRAAGFDEPRRRARRLLAVALGLSLSDVLAGDSRVLSGTEVEQVVAVLRRTLAHEPLSRIVGVREFWGLEFRLTSDTLDPRPDSETVVEAIVRRLPKHDRAYRFLDLGTGTGCLLLALLSEFQRATGLGIDRAEGAVAAARGNAERLGLSGRGRFAVGNWGEGLAERFDAIVANPPYIPSADIPDLPREVRDFDPVLALDGGADGLGAYRAIADDLPALLDLGGWFVGEIGQGQEAAVTDILCGAGLVVDAIVPDLAGIARCVVARRSG